MYDFSADSADCARSVEAGLSEYLTGARLSGPGPVADRLERFGVPPALSAGVVVLLLLGIIAGGIAVFALPLSEWVARGPLIWDKLQGNWPI